MTQSKTAAAQNQKPEARNVRAIRCEIVKPISESWDEIGPLLRTIRGVSHRLHTAAALEAIAADRERRHGKKTGNPETVAYQAVERELTEIREWAAKKLSASTEANASLERLSTLKLPGSMKACISQIAYAGFRKWVKDKSNARVPTWKHGAPIPCRADNVSFDLDQSGRVAMTVKLRSAGSVTFSVIAGRGSHWARLRSLAHPTDGVRHGDVKLTYSVREKKWFALVAYSEPVPPAPDLDPKVVMIVHRGQRNLIVAATNRGHYSVLATGNKLRAFKRGLAARRHDMQKVTRAERGDGAHGHGRKRRYSLPERLSEREHNFVKTLCQQMGARVVQLAKHWGAGTILIEDYGGIEPDKERGKRQFLERFPNHELRTCIEWSLRKIGMKLGTYEHRLMSQTCPRCGNVDATQHNTRTGVFHCKSCSYDRPIDVGSAIFALRQACGGYAGTWEERLSSELALAQSIKGSNT